MVSSLNLHVPESPEGDGPNEDLEVSYLRCVLLLSLSHCKPG